MFLREIKSKGKTYLNIIKTYKADGKVKHKSLASFGCIDNLEGTNKLKNVALSLPKYCKDKEYEYIISSRIKNKSKAVKQ